MLKLFMFFWTFFHIQRTMVQPTEWKSFLKDSADFSGQAAKTPLATHTCSFIALNSFILAWLVTYFNSNDRLSGLLFALAATIVFTCVVFHNPYALRFAGYVHMRVLKWIHVLFSVSFLIYLFRSHTPSGSSMILTISIGLKLARELPFLFPNSFTFNELVIVATLMSSGVFSFLMHFLVIIPAERTEIIIIEQALVWLVIVLAAMRNLAFASTSFVGFLATCSAVLVSYFVPMCWMLTNQNPFTWLYDYLFYQSAQRGFLFAYWIVLFACMILVVSVQNRLLALENHSENQVEARLNERYVEKLVTAMRKLFHLLICFVFILGLVNDRRLLHLCSYGMLILLALLEAVRMHDMGLVSEMLGKWTKMFADEKDAKSTLVLSHVFLLVGLSYPLWISSIQVFHVSHLSGLLTVGIGDTFASIIGSRFGRHRFKNSKKSVEGAVALILSQFVVFLVLNQLEVVNLFEFKTFYLVLTSLFISAYVEAFTKDNDNLLLPVCVYPILSLIP